MTKESNKENRDKKNTKPKKHWLQNILDFLFELFIA